MNSNRLDAFGKDGAEVVVTPQEEGGNPYLDDLTYVDFAFIVNKYTNDQCSLADLRDACSVTLTDTLPTYTDRNGVSRIAVLDADQNPGWTLSEDRKTVSRTYTLPRIDDPNLFGASGRGSEFPVRLRGAITPPEGYTVYYTTSPEVYTHSMEEMVDSDIWTTSVTDYASVTAFKLVAGEGTELAGNSRFQVRIPVCAPKTLTKTPWLSCARRSIRIRPAARSRGWRPSTPSASGPCRPPRSRNPTRSGPGCASRASA